MTQRIFGDGDELRWTPKAFEKLEEWADQVNRGINTVQQVAHQMANEVELNEDLRKHLTALADRVEFLEEFVAGKQLPTEPDIQWRPESDQLPVRRTRGIEEIERDHELTLISQRVNLVENGIKNMLADTNTMVGIPAHWMQHLGALLNLAHDASERLHRVRNGDD